MRKSRLLTLLACMGAGLALSILLAPPELAKPSVLTINDSRVDLLSDENEGPDQGPGDIAPGFFSEEVPADVADDYVVLRPGSVDGDHVVLDVVVTEVGDPVSGMTLKLSYPVEFSTFVGCTDGDLFPPGPCLFAETATGEVLVARTVATADQTTAVTGPQVILRLEFAVAAVGEGPISIEGQNLGGGDSSALLDVNGDLIFVQWFAGTLYGNQPSSQN